ncbi:MAG: VWA domain-containing protein [Succinatimonas sp.]|jgi:hypothetical protein|nr:VWA domain-containing protein [Succinatimonas sp.]
MLRIFRAKTSELDSRVIKFIPLYDAFYKEIYENLGEGYANIIAKPVLDGEYVNFYTNRSGEIGNFDKNFLSESVFNSLNDNLTNSKVKILNYLKAATPLKNSSLEPIRSDLIYIVSNLDKEFVLQKSNVVTCPYKLNKPFVDPTIVTATAATAGAATTAAVVHKRGCLIPFLLLLLLLLGLLFLLWWFLLRPWPMSGRWCEGIDRAFNTHICELKVDPNANQQVEPPVQEKVVDPIDDELAKKQALEAKAEEDRLKAEAEAKAKAEEERLKAEAEAKAKAEEERLKAEAEAKAKADAEKAKAEAAAKAKAEADAKAKAEAKAKADAEAKKKAANKVPKCKTLKEQGKMPEMAIAFDGSESMMIDFGNTTRLIAAKNAAKKLIQRTDKNVPIGLIEINGCPQAKDRGFFSPIQRPALIEAINRIDPYRYDSKTPLIDGLNKLASMLDGVNSEAVGILISDGEDTCPFTNGVDPCFVAQRIHAQKPKLKIHTILIGDSIDSASCIAHITGGKVFKPGDEVQIENELKQAGEQLKKVCEE